jgi:hypothetical protein
VKMMCFIFANLQAYGYHVPPSVETGCFPYLLTNSCRNSLAVASFSQKRF